MSIQFLLSQNNQPDPVISNSKVDNNIEYFEQQIEEIKNHKSKKKYVPDTCRIDQLSMPKKNRSSSKKGDNVTNKFLMMDGAKAISERKYRDVNNSVSKRDPTQKQISKSTAYNKPSKNISERNDENKDKYKTRSKSPIINHERV
eukprot:CAMPEP_0116896304 /NCGR_PEP_ID=MMETSP0467-20121206/5583_1 /TAXON_ID=283647 /ORGANISM="Mesodinium pulex, Strain SPMC105" /LENGTH=144 /DNA_ID=CAMNT_0004567411 /DNA_START=1661 /DNA_END=2095 /DNA_ORIENTATION=-